MRRPFPASRPDTITRANIARLNAERVKERQQPLTQESAELMATLLMGETGSGHSRAKLRHVARAERLMRPTHHTAVA